MEFSNYLLIILLYIFKTICKRRLLSLSLPENENTTWIRGSETRQTMKSTWYIHYLLQIFILGLHVNFTQYFIMIEYSQPIRFFIESQLYNNPTYQIICYSLITKHLENTHKPLWNLFVFKPGYHLLAVDLNSRSTLEILNLLCLEKN